MINKLFFNKFISFILFLKIFEGKREKQKKKIKRFGTHSVEVARLKVLLLTLIN